ncbi:MAG: hypothetical protein WCF84_09315 [Anaerolineae bacterium]
MRVNVVIFPDGQVSITVANGEFDAAKVAIQQAVEGLRASGVDFAEVGQIERHRHDDAHLNTGTHVHEH